MVMDLIGRCLQLYMTRSEVIDTLLSIEGIEPGLLSWRPIVVCLVGVKKVWKMLEIDNADFFREYNIWLLLKKHIHLFNDLLEKQSKLMKYITPAEVPLTPAEDFIKYADSGS